ncbi:winged helix-turn-helix transcriptional regulator [Pseudomonas chlororaphis]|uniref:winged helix-turn-helix transcriptional regulator n=1 Tax=Pseudomonas chlororaphis TaxID=587753 RepID=UPI000D0EB845|nr:helix-turn-helix domain-containing protein [Pseudomonas chlororaphis]AVO59203.1 transcriptional regulator [Pseudomonas chlororaphis subsp. piscium]
MKSEDQLPMPPFAPSLRCPLEQYLSVISGAWTSRIIWCLLQGRAYRFADIERAIDGISPKVLTKKLRDLEREHFVQRTVMNASKTPHVEYMLTDRGRALEPVFRAMEVAAMQLFGEPSAAAALSTQ